MKVVIHAGVDYISSQRMICIEYYLMNMGSKIVYRRNVDADPSGNTRNLFWLILYSKKPIYHIKDKLLLISQSPIIDTTTAATYNEGYYMTREFDINFTCDEIKKLFIK